MGSFCCWPIFGRLCQCRTLRTRGEMNSGGNAGSWGRQQNPTKTTQKRTQRLYQPASSVGGCRQRIQAVDIKDSTFDGNSDCDAMAVEVLLFSLTVCTPHIRTTTTGLLKVAKRLSGCFSQAAVAASRLRHPIRRSEPSMGRVPSPHY